MVALSPPVFRREESKGHRASTFQLAIWQAWLDYWQLVGEYKERLNAPVYGLALGDLGDLNKHSNAQLISPLKTDVHRALLDVMEPAQVVVDSWFFVRGTEAHVGASGEIEEWLANDTKNAVHSFASTASWWVWNAEIAGVRIHATHHPPSGTKLAGNRGEAVSRSCRYLANECEENGATKPHLAFWAHRHWYAPGYNLGIYGYAVPSWKGLGAFGRRIGIGHPSPVGGLICIIPGLDGEAWTVKPPFLRKPPALPIWTPDSTETSTSTPRSSSRKSKSGKRRGLLSRLARSRGDSS